MLTPNKPDKANNANNDQLRTATASARLYFVVAMVSGLVLLTSHIFDRVELQTINARFELRPWVNWAPAGLAKLNPLTLWQYHEQHEIPRRWWHWDYTLSWLLEDNHPQSQHKFVLFNHQLEDEPPLAALKEHPWIKPLFQYPLSRATLADSIIFLARAGARLIILDNDFPQYSADDHKLAQAILSCRDGSAAGHPVPVLLARTINHHSLNNILQLEIPTAPNGIMLELNKISPHLDALGELTGSTGVTLDEDQVVRRLASRIPTVTGDVDSIAIKALKMTNNPVTGEVPMYLDIDFAGPPNSEIYPVRPISYLLDPERRSAMVKTNKTNQDVTLAGAIVIMGDSVVDVFNTPTTNFGANQMSGAEILANAIDTLSRRSWLIRLDYWHQVGYLTTLVLTAAFLSYLFKTLPGKTGQTIQKVLSQQPKRKANYHQAELFGFLLLIAFSYFLAILIFAKLGYVVPIVVPAISLTLAALASVQWEREQEKAAAYKRDLQAAEDKLALQAQLHQSDLARQRAVADAREAAMDKERRKEFARRINHDLRAPVSVLSWTIAKLRGKKITEEEKKEKIDRLSNTADRLFALINELVSTYNAGTEADEGGDSERSKKAICNIGEVLNDCFKMQQVLAEEKHGLLQLSIIETPCLLKASGLQLARVVDNIIRNAFLHNAENIKVTIDLSSNGRNHVVRISDNGQGIGREHIEKIFTPGYRIEKAVDDYAADGEGLGLDIVQSFVENMNGSVHVESTVGVGTTFIINLPAAPAESTAVLGEPAQLPQPTILALESARRQG